MATEEEGWRRGEKYDAEEENGSVITSNDMTSYCYYHTVYRILK
jgi:hypothetical protein